MLQTFLDIFNQGGPIVYPIFMVSVWAWYMGIVKYVRIHRIGRSRRRFWRLYGQRSEGTTGTAAYDDLLKTALRGPDCGSAVLRSAVRCFLSRLVPEVERGFSTIATCATAAPLLGLLGTISGMKRMFDVIGQFGYGSPLLMAGAISIALQSSLTGLAVAVAAMLVHNHLRNRAGLCVRLLISDAECLMAERRVPTDA